MNRTNATATRRHARDHSDKPSYYRPRRQMTAEERAENEARFLQHQQAAQARLQQQMCGSPQAQATQVKPMRREDKYDKALEVAQLFEVERVQVAPNAWHYHVPCLSGAHPEHLVVLRAGQVQCVNCEARAICYHILCSVGRPVAVFVQQCRGVVDAEELRLIYDYHIAALLGLPESLKALARAELEAAKLRLEAQTINSADQIAA
jgi:hypothetical protein